MLSRSTANTSNKSKGIPPSVTIITGAWAIPCGVGNGACDTEPAVIPVQRGALLVGAQSLRDGDNTRDNRVDTHDPAASVGGHVAVHRHPLAEVPVDGDGVDTAQRVPVHQVLRAVLRVGEDTSSCTVKRKRRNSSKETPFRHASVPTSYNPGKVCLGFCVPSNAPRWGDFISAINFRGLTGKKTCAYINYSSICPVLERCVVTSR